LLTEHEALSQLQENTHSDLSVLKVQEAKLSVQHRELTTSNTNLVAQYESLSCQNKGLLAEHQLVSSQL